MRALLDVNVLIALLDADHVHHIRASDWLAREGQRGWASCPLTQNGCVRIMSQPAYPNPVSIPAVVERLADAARHPSHVFWPDDVSVLDAMSIDTNRIHGPKQLTDVYLLALAVAHEGRFATLDPRVSRSPVTSAEPHHLVLID